MSRKYVAAALPLVCLWGAGARGAEPTIAPGEREPVLRVEAGGPTSLVRALAFSPDGRTLYAAGFDKVVRVYKVNGQGDWVLERLAYRVPVGPGFDGWINAIAVSPDGIWLAAGGIGVVREAAGRYPGLVVPREGRLSPAMWQDMGTIWLFNTRTQEVRPLRGNRGPILSLTFAPGREGKPPLLVSAAQEYDERDRKDYGVLALWDVTSARDQNPLVRRWVGIGVPPGPVVTPGLAPWHTGPGLTDLRVAIAWRGDRLRVWDVAHGEDGLWSAADGADNDTVIGLGKPGSLLTGSHADGFGRLQFWAGEEAPSSDGEPRIALPPDAETDARLFPRAIGLFASREGGAPDFAAVVVRVGREGDSYRLALLDLSGERPRLRTADLPLWGRSDNLPVIATAPGGRFLALAGDQDHEILVFPVEGLLAGNAEPKRLRSVGASQRSASFVRKGKELGLLLNERTVKRRGEVPDSPREGDRVFDLRRRTLTADAQGWRVDAPAGEGWRAVAEAGRAVAVYRGDDLVRRFRPKGLDRCTDLAVLPPREPWNVPLLAVAFLDSNMQPHLTLHNARTGEQVRQFTGHTDPIRSLAFSGDGRLLVSAAEDQTVAVWTLTDLGRWLGARGMLAGVAVKRHDGRLVAVRVDPDCPAADDIKPGDGITGLVEEQGVRELKTAHEFYEILSLHKPGSEVTLRTADNRNVRVRLGQAVDDRKPLFWLFVTRPDPAGDREWLGWNPIGPYDASTRKTERLIGWHLNTGDPARPTAFALADQYRRQLYRPGILHDLAVQGNLPDALRRWDEEDREKPLPDPKRMVWVDELGPDAPADADGQLLVRRRPVTLKIRVNDFPLDKVESITWRLAGEEKAHDAGEPVGGVWSADLSRLPWQRGNLFAVRVTIRTREARPRELTSDLHLRYQPPPPEIVIGEGARRARVTDADFVLQADVHPGLGDEPVDVRVVHRLPGGARPAEYREGPKVRRSLKLAPGHNELEIVARNRNALAGHEDFETRRLRLGVDYLPKEDRQAPPPRIVLEKVIVSDDDGIQAPALQAGEPTVVTAPSVRVAGRIEATERLARAEREFAGGAPRRLAGFDADQSALDVNEPLPPLTPGKQTVRFRAKTVSGAEAVTAIVLDYRPRLPAVALQEPARDLVLLVDGKALPQVKVVWKLLPRNREPFRAAVLVNGRPIKGPVDVADAAAGEKSVSVLLPLPRWGDNRITLRLTNEHQSPPVTDEVFVRLKRPPRIVFGGPGDGKEPLTVDRAQADLAFRATSALPLKPDSVRVQVNQTERTVRPEIRQADNGQWTVTLHGAALEPGRNDVRVWVANADGDAEEPGRVTVVWRPRRPAPEVLILEPREATVTRPEIRVRGTVRSTSPIQQVELVREGDRPFRQSFALGDLKPDAQGVLVYPFEATVPLVPRANRVRVEAVNDGGAADARVVVTYLRAPVRLVIDRLKSKGRDGRTAEPTLLADGQVQVGRWPAGRLTVEGHVMTGPAERQDAGRVRVHVNGFLQPPARLGAADPAHPGQRPFRAELLLNRTLNTVEMELADIAQEAGSRQEFTVVCDRPVAGQRLHYLIFGVGEKDRAKLEKDAMNALGAVAGPDGNYHTRAFAEIYPYVVAGHIRPDRITDQMVKVQDTIDRLATQGSANDVVLVYYQGGEAVNKDGHFFTTSISRNNALLQHTGITCAWVEEWVNETLGAKILWLDVERANAPEGLGSGEVLDRIRKWDDESRAVVWRSARPEGGPESLNRRWLLLALDEAMPRGPRRLAEVESGVRSVLRGLLSGSSALNVVLLEPPVYRDLEIGPGSSAR